MREILEATGPALELFGWIALAGAIAFFVVARVSRRGLADWLEAPCEVTVLEGQPCLVWTSSDGTAHSRALDELESVPGRTPEHVYYKAAAPQRIQLEQPRSHARFMLVLAWTMLGLWALCNVVPLVLHQLTISEPS
ncbi:hypothetical protein ACSYDW_04550 [Paeniglutamicibacter sp. R2-26]|uniref:hypothetical protein n=1 Tax=Paeniglutamicibacter sp. R2-26 TaxID=3144417 RepID=UPI003EE43B3C